MKEGGTASVVRPTISLPAKKGPARSHFARNRKAADFRIRNLCDLCDLLCNFTAFVRKRGCSKLRARM